MKPLQLFDPASSTYTYVLFDPVTREALIIDPVDDQIERDLAVLRDHALKLTWTVETHAHADHITSAGHLAEHAGARTAAPAGCGITTAAVQLQFESIVPLPVIPQELAADVHGCPSDGQVGAGSGIQTDQQ